MLTYPMEERGSLPLYEYLCRRIRADILSGALPAGTRLPSKRALAEHLRVSVVTVESAYSQLEAEGYLQARPKRGFFVSAVERAPPPAVRSVLMPETPAVSWRLDLGRNQVDTARFPVSTWARLTRQVLSEAPEALLSPVPHQGLAALRQAIADDLRDFKGMAVSPEQIVIGAVRNTFTYCWPNCWAGTRCSPWRTPAIPRSVRSMTPAGPSAPPIPLDNQGVELAALMRSKARALHISPNHQYPTGLVTPIARRQALLRWAEDTGSTIIEDDYDSEFRYTGRPIPTLQSIDDRGRVIYLNTFSQTISPSMRLGFLVLPPRLLERYRQELGFYACTVPALAQHVLARFIAGGHYERHLSRMRKEYRDRRSATISAFRASPLASHVTFSEEGAGLHFLLRLDTNRSDEELRRLTAEAGIRLSFLSEYAAVPDPRFAHTLVINYAGLSQSDLEEALQLLTDVLLPLLA